MRKAKPTPSIAELEAWGLAYDPTTGVITKHGHPVGYRRRDGYTTISLGYNNRFLVHRVAWKFMTGCEAPDDVDHHDLDPSNNRWGNLRSATYSQSRQNSRARSRTGFKGVTRVLRNKGKLVYFSAQIQHGRERRHLGYFKTPEEAHAAYCAAADKEFGEFSRHG